LPLREPPRARVLPRLHEGGLDGAGLLPWRGVLDRRVLRSRGAVPERRATDDDRVEGRRIDQRDDDPRRRTDRGRAACGGDAVARRPGEHPMLSRARRHASDHRHQSALRRRLPPADGRREPLSGARALARRGRTAGAAARRFPRGPLHDAVLLGARARRRACRYLGSVRGRAPGTGRGLLGVFLLSLAAGCGGGASHPVTGPAATLHRALPEPSYRARLVVTVVDGDAGVRVPGAVVDLWYRSARTDRHGVAEIVVPGRHDLNVTVRARGYGSRTLYEPFVQFRHVTVRIYRPQLQWPVYGATPSRSQAQQYIRLRPPFRTVWAVPLGGLIEFPAVVDDGVAYIGNFKGTLHAISMRFGTILWRHETPHGEMASSPAVDGDKLVYHSMDGHVFVLDRADGRLVWSWTVGSAIESSPIVRDGVDYFGT